MIEMLARKCQSGDLWISVAKARLQNHEWGLAYSALCSGMKTGGLSDLEDARRLLRDICERMGVPEAVE